ncbi:MAG TPA: hypothetical protein VFA68_08615 [Terriglobales bacterium]|nr:hypothetical protein [Terriglobales bacterium]
MVRQSFGEVDPGRPLPDRHLRLRVAVAEGASVEFDGARIGFVRRTSLGGRGCPTQVQIYLNSLGQVLIPDDSYATWARSSEGEIQVAIPPGHSSKPVRLGGMLKVQP